MRNLPILFAFGLFACAPAAQGPRPVNVAFIRHDIQLALPEGRVVTSMGHTTEQSAMVFTAERAGGSRHEETWMRTGDGWKLQSSRDLTATK
ncbi:MAG: hypothetical protein JWO36_7156 [Myxococcales bacterium]|nr:hypothetical protein [Myxococcales bacterium]